MKTVLAVLLVLSAGSQAQANGSFGREVSIIHVQPTYEVRKQSEINQFRKEVRRLRRIEETEFRRAVKDAVREEIRQEKAATKAYEKKLAAQRKARRK